MWLMSKEDTLITAPFWAWKELLALSGLPSTMPFEEAESEASDWAEDLLGPKYRQKTLSELTTLLATYRAEGAAWQDEIFHDIDPNPDKTRVEMLVARAKANLVARILRERGLDPKATLAAMRKQTLLSASKV